MKFNCIFASFLLVGKIFVGHSIVSEETVPAVFYYTLYSEKACASGLPGYLLHAMQQTHMFQQSLTGTVKTSIIFLSNPSHCTDILRNSANSTNNNTMNTITSFYPPFIDIVDVGLIESARHKLFRSHVSRLYPALTNELWTNSMFRFFAIEDLMRSRSDLKEIIHIESDNLVYGNLQKMVRMLRQNFPTLATTQLAPHMMTASVFWVANLSALEAFNSFLMTLCDVSTHDWGASLWFEYLTLLHQKVNKKLLPGGFPLTDPNKSVNKTLSLSAVRRRRALLDATAPPFPLNITSQNKSKAKSRNRTADNLLPRGVPVPAVNEMTMMAFYRLKYPAQLQALPLFPDSGLVAHSKHFPFRTMSTHMFAPTGSKQPTHSVANHSLLESGGVFDAGSYGQFLGGIPSDKARKGFIDVGHVIGKAMVRSACRVSVRCAMIGGGGGGGGGGGMKIKIGAREEEEVLISHIHLYSSDILHLNYKPYNSNGALCMTLPHVQCCAGGINGTECGVPTPLWNMHIHSKNVTGFVSMVCDC